MSGGYLKGSEFLGWLRRRLSFIEYKGLMDIVKRVLENFIVKFCFFKMV